MRHTLTLLLLVAVVLSYSQEVKNPFFNILPNQSIQFYLNESGNVTIKSKASYYRIAYIDSNFSYVGNIKDYYPNKETAFICNFENGELNGRITRFHPNGQIKYSGFYNNSKKDSLWIYYYDNGQKQKVFSYENNQPYFIESFKKNGKTVFQNGNGKFKGVIIPNHKSNIKYHISGQINNGKMEGKWNWSASRRHGSEYYENGIFIKAKDDFGYVDKTQTISLTSNDFHEKVALYSFIATPEKNTTVSGDFKISGTPVVFQGKYVENSTNFEKILKFKNNTNLNKTFSLELKSKLLKTFQTTDLNNFWSFIQFSISEKSQIEDISVISSNKHIKDIITQYISGLKDFETVLIEDKPSKCHVYMCIFFNDGKLYTPNYNYDYMYNFN